MRSGTSWTKVTVTFIQKPYSMDQLAEAIINALRPNPDRD